MQVAAKEGRDLTLVDGNFAIVDVSTLQEALVQFFHCARSSFFMQLDFKLLFSTIKFSWKSLHAIASLRGFFFTLKMHMIKLQWMCYKTTVHIAFLL